jgi:multicomponent Na+:H+ antiporter subunit E
MTGAAFRPEPGRASLWRFLGVRRLLVVGLLTLAWCALWGRISIANVLSGLVLAVTITAVGVATDYTGGVRFVPLLRFAAMAGIDLVRSTVNVAIEILTPTDYTEESIIAVELPREARHHLLLLIVAVTVTPGTAVVDADPDTGTLYLHLLHHERRDETASHVRELADLACQAFPMRSGQALADRATEGAP